ncbi:MAG: flagellum-specific ATP synthase FliI, partial [Roseomonas sp.]|nr:flagellum-specific ATP synthase FliI [Roseomonas sp.]
MLPDFHATAAALGALPREGIHGHVNAITGLTITLEGFGPLAAIGDRVAITSPSGAPVMAEIAGFRDGKAQAIALGPLTG